MNRPGLFLSVLTRVWLAAVLLLFGGSSAVGQMLMQEPDLAGLFGLGESGPAPLLRDAARGWNYFGDNSARSASVDGVVFSGPLFRVSDSGVPDTRWRLPMEFWIADQYLAPDGTPVVQAMTDRTPPYQWRWYRLPRDSVGDVVPLEVPKTDDLPPRDSVRLDSSSSNQPLPLRLADGSTVALDVARAPAPSYALSYALRKRNALGSELWFRPIGGVPHNFAVDAADNVYVLGVALNIGGQTGNLLRVLGDGTVDTHWKPVIEITQYVQSTLRAVADRVVVADYVGGNPGVNRLSSFNLQNGATIAQRFTKNSLGAIDENGSTTTGAAGGQWSLLDTRRSDDGGDRLSKARVGGAAEVSAVVRWGDYYVIGGNFAYWFDGRLYRNLMRLDAASYRPDPTWYPQPAEMVSALAVDSQQRLVAATRSASRLQATLIRFGVNGAEDPTWRASIAGGVYKLLAASDGMLFISGAFSAVDGVARGSIARFRPDGALDVAWARESTFGGLSPAPLGQFGRDGIYAMLDAGADGVFFVWEDGAMNSFSRGVMRFARDGGGTQLPVPSAVDGAPEYSTGGGSLLRDPVSGAIYAIAAGWYIPPVATQRGTALVRLTRPDMAIDVNWTTLAGEYGRQFTGFAYQTESHVYVCRGGLVRRFDKVTGSEDPSWSSNETYLCAATLAERTPDGATLSALTWGVLARINNNATNEALSVVEYYARDIKRFFITGRPHEIAQLDALPVSFERTGMQFDAAAARVRDADPSSAAICRFYAEPATGGSNTHFYGTGDECVMAKRISLLKYEGYDFRAGMPSNGTCAGTKPYPVYRLFNGRVATNEGNHRYVVSDARRTEMVAAGWVDEGVAFCVANAVDQKPFAGVGL